MYFLLLRLIFFIACDLPADDCPNAYLDILSDPAWVTPSPVSAILSPGRRTVLSLSCIQRTTGRGFPETEQSTVTGSPTGTTTWDLGLTVILGASFTLTQAEAETESKYSMLNC